MGRFRSSTALAVGLVCVLLAEDSRADKDVWSLNLDVGYGLLGQSGGDLPPSVLGPQVSGAIQTAWSFDLLALVVAVRGTLLVTRGSGGAYMTTLGLGPALRGELGAIELAAEFGVLRYDEANFDSEAGTQHPGGSHTLACAVGRVSPVLHLSRLWSLYLDVAALFGFGFEASQAMPYGGSAALGVRLRL